MVMTDKAHAFGHALLAGEQMAENVVQAIVGLNVGENLLRAALLKYES
jgi:hypothetical protein